MTTSNTPTRPQSIPFVQVRTSAGRLRGDLVRLHGKRYVQIALLRTVPGHPERQHIRHAIRLPLSEWRAFVTLTKRLPAAVRVALAEEGEPEATDPRTISLVDSLVDRVRALRARGMDKAEASQRALVELFNQRGNTE